MAVPFVVCGVLGMTHVNHSSFVLESARCMITHPFSCRCHDAVGSNTAVDFVRVQQASIPRGLLHVAMDQPCLVP